MFAHQIHRCVLYLTPFSLERLNLSDNNFFGTIPSQLGTMQSLSKSRWVEHVISFAKIANSYYLALVSDLAVCSPTVPLRKFPNFNHPKSARSVRSTGAIGFRIEPVGWNYSNHPRFDAPASRAFSLWKYLDRKCTK